MAVTMRVSEHTRDQINGLADELGAKSADEAIRRLIDEHWWNAAIAETRHYFAENPGDEDAEIDELNAWTDADPSDPSNL